jgi:hypothetical protein
MTTPERNPIEVCVQCKSTLKEKFEPIDINDFKREVDTFLSSKIECERYILALNRNDFDGQVEKAFGEHRKTSNGLKVEVWPLSKIVDEAQEAVRLMILRRVKLFNETWREQLIGRFAPSGAWVRRVPASTYRMMLDWEIEPEIREEVRTGEIDVKDLLLSEKGPHMGLLIGDDGTGKTSAALITSQADDKTVIYVPAASLPTETSRGTNVLTREIARAIDFDLSNEEKGQLFDFFMGRGLARILRQDPNVVLIVDGLDENRAYRGFEGLKLIRSQLKGMRCKIIISTRTKHFNLRTGDFSQALQVKGNVGRRNKGIRVVELRPWTDNTIIQHVEDAAQTLTGQPREALRNLADLIREKKASELYGTLLSHPIFLDLIIDDVVNEKIQRTTRSVLVRSWILRKIKRDQDKYQGEPIGGDVTTEARLIFRALEDVALQMSEPKARTPLERISHSDASNIFVQYGLTKNEIFELLLKSVLVAAGQTTTFRDANIMFSHRVFHEYMIASALKRTGERPSADTPSEIVRFYEELANP